MKMLTRITHILKQYLFKTILILIIIGIISFFILKEEKVPVELFLLTSDSLMAEGITVGGTVFAQEEVSLAFETSGRVAQVNAQAGERVSQGSMIASLDTGILYANIAKAEAELDAEIARLEQLKVSSQIDQNELRVKKDQLIRELKNAYVVADDAIYNKTDQYFESPTSRFPEIYFIFSDYTLSQVINNARYEIGRVLENWEAYISSGTVYEGDLTESTVQIQQYVTNVQNYLTLVATAVNKFESNSVYSQTQIDKFKNDTTVARTNMNTVSAGILSSQQNVRALVSEVPFQEAKVKSAEAVIQNYNAEIENSVIRAPFDGLITVQDAKLGTSVSANQEVVSMISDTNFGIETYVPEIYISQIKEGSTAEVFLSAYGSREAFPATVTHIDPAATMRDGVASYKVELVFLNIDARIKAGMTGDINVAIEGENQAFWIPTEAIIDQGGFNYVKVQSGQVVELRKITIGERTLEETEVLDGLIVGDQIVIEKIQ